MTQPAKCNKARRVEQTNPRFVSSSLPPPRRLRQHGAAAAALPLILLPKENMVRQFVGSLLVGDRSKVRALKRLAQGTSKTAGRNSSGRITSFHRGGGAKRLHRNVDVKRGTSAVGVIDRVEYDPNRSSSIALVRWVQGVHFRRHNTSKSDAEEISGDSSTTANVSARFSLAAPFSSSAQPKVASSLLHSSLGNNGDATTLTSLPRIAVAGAKPNFFATQGISNGKEDPSSEGKQTFSLSEIQKWAADEALWTQRMKRQAALSWQNDLKKKPTSVQRLFSNMAPSTSNNNKGPKANVDRVPVSYILATHQCMPGTTVMNCDSSKPSKSSSSLGSSANQYDVIDLNSKAGNCVPLANVRIGTWVHDIECRPGQGGKMVRAAGTYAKVVQEPGAQCVLRLPSGAEKTVDSKCRATIGLVSNPSHGARKLTKAGHSRWFGRRPVVRGVAMNPVDHPHGGGEGRTKGGRPSVSPWGKPTKAGYRSPSVASRKA
ncbi:hypothetical protein PR202_gb10891 [Eleusine coracana subsp. coracana]|uniref:Large ribosomal subunit protein uL2m n=1 Tax=Eleusine coracana subsp. coracana TaxID=191504 RepID=A0AAV5ELL4_ELECO|nr:hypothetical protein PR202_gb10891 [Eleusine coracana subsp. coracana]